MPLLDSKLFFNVHVCVCVCAVHHLPPSQLISWHKVDCNEHCIIVAYMKPVHSLPTHTPTHITSAAGVLNAAVYFSLVSGLDWKTHRHISVALIHLTDFKIPSATSKNPHRSYTHTHTHTHTNMYQPSVCCDGVLGGTAHWGEANTLLRVPVTFLQLHCHIASLLTHHYPSSCYITAQQHQLPRK